MAFSEDDMGGFRSCFELAPDACYLNDLHGNFVDGNRAAERLVGYSREELIGRNFLSLRLLQPRDIPRAAALLARNAAGWPTGPSEFVVTRKDGAQVPIEIRTQPITVDGRRFVLGIARNVTERRMADARVRESEARYRDLFDHTTEMIQCIEPGGAFVYVNRAWESTLEYSSADLIGLNALDVIHPDNLAHCEDLFARIKLGEEVGTFEAILLTKNGESVFVEGNASCSHDGEVPVSTRVFLRDVTARKTAEAALSQLNDELEERVKHRTAELSEANKRLTEEIQCHRQARQELVASQTQFKNAQQAAHVGTFRLTAPTYDPAYWSEECFRILGLRPSDPIPSRDHFIRNIVHPSDREKSDRVTMECVRDGRPYTYEYRIIRADGATRWVSSKGEPLYEDGEVVAIQGTFHDVTDRKQAELTTWESEERFRAIFDSEPECVKLLDRQGNLLDMNAAGLALVEADSIDDVLGQCIYTVVAPEHRAAFVAVNESVFSGESGVLQFEIIGLRGTRRWMETHAVPLRDAAGEITAALSVTRDITEQKRSEEAIRDSESRLGIALERLELAVRGTSDGLWDWDVTARQFWISPRGMELLGHEPEEWTAPQEFLADIIHPDDLDRVQRASEQHFAEHEPFDIEHRLMFANGDYRWFRSRGCAARDKSGAPIRMSGSICDVTELRQAEAEREARMRHLQAMDRINHLIVVAANAEEMLENVMEAMLDIMGCDRAWLCHPCDPETRTVRLPVSCSRPEFPGVVGSEAEFPLDEQSRMVMRTLLDTGEPIGFHGAGVNDAIAPELASEFQIRALMVLGLRPRTGAAWSLGLHQCAYARVWSDEDKRLVKDIGRRIEDALTSLLSLRDLRESEERFRTLVKHAPEAILVHDVDQNRFVDWNPNALALLKLSAEEIAELGPVDISSPEQSLSDSVAEFARQKTECALAGEYTVFEWMFRDSAGHEIPCEVRLTRLPSAQRRLVRGSITDISRRKELEEKARQHHRLLAHTSRVATIGEMATGFAHELNQPLAAISMFSNACLAKLDSDPTNVEAISAILRSLSEQSLRAGSIVDRIRKFLGKEEFIQTACRMDNLFDEVLSLLNAELTEREITVDVLLPHSLNNVHVDRVQIEQVLVNLVHNSVDAIGECPTAPRRLELAARDRDDRFVEVQVRDFGPGMTDDVAAKAFEAFYSTKSKGMGMGLAICRTIVEAHGGRIEMAPNRGAGVTCSFTLPIFEELPSCPTTMKHSSVS